MTPRTARRVDPARLRRAVYLDVDPRDSGVWTVTGGAEAHRVTERGRRLDCDCADRQIRGVGCKHVLAVALHRGHPAVLRELRTIVEPEGRT